VRAPVAGAGLLHPLPLAAVALLVLNDHLLKHSFPGLVTGKLSDLAGLAFFPLLLQALWETGQVLLRRPWQPSARVLAVTTLATALAFSLVNLSTAASDAWALLLGALQWPVHALAALARGAAPPGLRPTLSTRDPTDLLALPTLALAVRIGLRRVSEVAADAPRQAEKPLADDPAGG
jgi:hypothetical protein